jgi:hypothetical protein
MINPTPTPTPTPIPVVFALFVSCGCPITDVVATEAVVDILSERIEDVAVCSSVFVVLAPFTAPCNAKTTLCV